VGPSTDPALLGVLAELAAREPLFHRPELGTTAADLDRQMAPDFWEVGASGRVYDREFVRRTLLERHAAGADDPWETSEFACRQVGPDTYLLTYLLVQGRRRTRRVTAWRRGPQGWQVLYHQGTLVAD
jgi:hypothetical protein